MLVHSPGCGFCRMMRPAFDDARRRLVADHGVQVVEIDADAMRAAPQDGNPMLSALHNGFGGVPHIVLFGPRGASSSRYSGDRTSESLVAFARR